MLNNEGKAEFCPGCPMKGRYVGAVSADNFQTGPPSFGKFVDEDGIPSDRLVSSIDSPRPKALFREGDNHFIELLVRRIGRCSGVRTEPSNKFGYWATCPAVSPSVVDELVLKHTEDIS